MAVKISLTQFIHFKAAVSTRARISAVQRIKNNEYSPAIDYWLDLRNAINKFSERRITLEELNTLADSENERKKANYSKAINRFSNFISKNNVSFFPVNKSNWEYEGLVITASPEVGMIIGDSRFLVKIFYNVKKPDEKVTKRNIMPSLSLLDIANKASNHDRQVGLLNLQNGKLLTPDNSKLETSLLELQIDAKNFMNFWEMV